MADDDLTDLEIADEIERCVSDVVAIANGPADETLASS
jgi:hypothetical protein